ncbi:MAG: hypothetical protein KKE30_04315 [Gammaproteobacteria bacterium]|nr:hypothetical protein [Gammaproteobacteria bacterium]MBU1553458.1 hypothetical protein [Gammaproteobacteria bacterium]MBU2070744.1 hypothetical protein [Gammaproteobacteria bacterium]MBU2182735.1 hypothetical protein [Gammaproteobacteria bacterium]MBU2206023.1 hypothetical protein [Gammaproteobacteria bacterium]
MAQLEICLSSDSDYLVQNIAKVCAAGADSIELCSQMAEQGLSVPAAVLRQARQACRADTKLRVMIRSRAGDFVYSPAEKQLMLQQINQAAELGADGVVLGAVLPDNQLDQHFMQTAAELCKRLTLDCTMHRAFDLCQNSAATLDLLVMLGVKRVLSNGTPWLSGLPISAGMAELAALQRHNQQRLTLVAGGGVTADNLPFLRRQLADGPQLCWHLYSAVLTGQQIDAQKLQTVRRLVKAVVASEHV